MSFFREMYYWTYQILREDKMEIESERAKRACMFLGILQMANVALVLIILNAFLKIKLGMDVVIIAGVLLPVIIYVINLFYLYKRREEIFEKYKYITPERRRNGIIIFWLYVVGSVALLFYFGEMLIIPVYK